MSMDNEKDLFENQEAELNEEVKEEFIERIEEAAVNEETVQDEDTADEDVNPDGDPEAGNAEDAVDVVIPEIPEKAPISKAAVSAISVVITLVICLAAAAAWYFTCYNPYNANTDGYAMDVATVAKLNGVTIEEIKEQYAIPANIPDDTIMEVAINYAPAEKMAELMYGMAIEDLKEAAKLENIEITSETLWGDIQIAMLEQSVAEREAAKAEEGNATEEEATEEATEEAPAEEETEEAADAEAEKAE